MAPYWEDALHSLRDARHVIDIRNLGLIGGVELEPRPGKPTERALEAFRACFDKGLLIRVTGDIIALSPPLIIEKAQIDQIVDTIRSVLRHARLGAATGKVEIRFRIRLAIQREVPPFFPKRPKAFAGHRRLQPCLFARACEPDRLVRRPRPRVEEVIAASHVDFRAA